jgi:ABC-2 type transport system ATP-binding protein
MPAILEVEHLVKKYGDFAAVNDVSFRVEEGEIFGLLGPNGAGKTQTISMLTGVIEPTEGTARVAGHDIRSDLGQAKKVMGLVPQDLALYPTLSARANLNFFGRIYGLRGKALKERVEDVLHIVSLSDRADEEIAHYSGGMKRRVNIAAGLVHQPRLLFLDEPTVGVDPQSRNHIFESVQQLNRERGLSIVYTSHYMEEVELLCKRVAIIDRGRIIALDTIRNLKAMLGGGIIQVGVPYLDQTLLSQMAGLPAVQDACPGDQPVLYVEGDELSADEQTNGSNGTTVKIMAESSQEALVNVISFLNEQSLPITSLNILEPNLENVFLHLTGKKLRE